MFVANCVHRSTDNMFNTSERLPLNIYKWIFLERGWPLHINRFFICLTNQIQWITCFFLFVQKQMRKHQDICKYNIEILTKNISYILLWHIQIAAYSVSRGKQTECHFRFNFKWIDVCKEKKILRNLSQMQWFLFSY